MNRISWKLVSGFLVATGLAISLLTFNMGKENPIRESFSGGSNSVHITVSENQTSQYFNLDLNFLFDNTEQEKPVEVFSIDTDTRRITLLLREDGYFAVGNIGGKVFQKIPLEKGIHKVSIQYDPLNGMRVVSDGKVFLASSIAIDILKVVSANSITINPQSSPLISEVQGKLASSNKLQTKSISLMSFGGILLVFLGTVFGWIFFSSERVPISKNQSFHRVIYIATVITVVTMSTGIILDLLDLSSMTYVSPAIKRSDWFDSIISSWGNPYAAATVAYPPFAYLFFSLIPKAFSSIFFWILTALAVGTITGISSILLRISNRFWGYFPGVILSLGFPTYFAIDRGNLDIIAVALIMISLLMIVINRSMQSAILGGIASSLKLFPLPFILLFQAENNHNKIRQAVIVILSFMSLSLIALVFLGVPMGEWTSTFLASSNLALNPPQNFSNSSLSLGSAIVEMTSNLDKFGFEGNGTRAVYKGVSSSPYTLISIAVIGMTFIWAYSFKGNRWLQMGIFTLVFFLLSPITYLYRGMLFLAWLGVMSREQSKIGGPTFLGIMIGLLFSPVAPLINWISGDVHVSTIVTVALETTLLLTLLLHLKKVRVVNSPYFRNKDLILRAARIGKK